MDAICQINVSKENDLYVLTDVISDISAKGATMPEATNNLKPMLEEYYKSQTVVMDLLERN